MARGEKKRGRKRSWLSILCAIAALAWIIGFVTFTTTIPDDAPGNQQQTDAIVVLTGGSLRLETGMALLEAGVADKLFVSGVHRGVDVEELLRIQAQAPDRLRCCIVLGHMAENTIGNAEETAEWIAAEGVQSIRLVTAGYHMPRSLLELRAAMPSTEIIPHPVSPEHVKHADWYRYPGTALLLAGEYTKLLLAWCRLTLIELVTEATG